MQQIYKHIMHTYALFIIDALQIMGPMASNAYKAADFRYP